MLSTATDRAPIGRRSLLGLLAGGLAWPMLPLRLRAEAAAERLYLSARGDGAGGFLVSGFTAEGRPRFDLPLPARGHSFAIRPGAREAVHFARRPGTFALVLDLEKGAARREIEAPDGRHFYGHGVFAADGRLLYAAENDYREGRGVIGVYDPAADYRRIAELSSHGIGPHEIRLLSDGETLVAANGGIQTHPDLPRVKLNLPTMRPSLVYLDRRDGRHLKTVELAPELFQLSIRHLAVGPDDTVAIAMQYEGPGGDAVPLVASHRGDRPARLFEAPAGPLRAMNHYCGTTNFDRSGRILAVSAPRGNLATFWDATSGTLLSAVEVADGCGIAPAAKDGQFLASSGAGGVFLIEAPTGRARRIVSYFLEAGQWDNHMVSATA